MVLFKSAFNNIVQDMSYRSLKSCSTSAGQIDSPPLLWREKYPLCRIGLRGVGWKGPPPYPKGLKGPVTKIFFWSKWLAKGKMKKQAGDELWAGLTSAGAISQLAHWSLQVVWKLSWNSLKKNFCLKITISELRIHWHGGVDEMQNKAKIHWAWQYRPIGSDAFACGFHVVKGQFRMMQSQSSLYVDIFWVLWLI